MRAVAFTDMQIAELPKDPDRLISMLDTGRPLTATELYLQLSGREPADLLTDRHNSARRALSFGLSLLSLERRVERHDNPPHMASYSKIDCHSCGEPNQSECLEARWACGHHCNHSWSHDRCCWCEVGFGENGVETQDA